MFGKWANAPGPVIGFYRIWIATLILLPVFLFRNHKNGVKFPMAILLFPILGGIFTALDHGTWNSSLRYTSAANATLLGNTAPLWVALFAWLVFRQKLRGLFWVGLAFALAGAAIVLGSDFIRHPSIGLGDMLALAAGVFYAGYFVVTERGRQKMDTLSYVWMVDLIAAFTLLLISLGMRMPLTGYPAQSYLAFLGAALVSQVGGVLIHWVCTGALARLNCRAYTDRTTRGDCPSGNSLTGGSSAHRAMDRRFSGIAGYLSGAPQPDGKPTRRNTNLVK